MHPAEHLPRRIDTVRAAAGDPVERRPAWPIDAGQAKHMRPRGQPRSIRLGARAAAARAGWGALIDPRASCIAVNAGRGEITAPCRSARQERAIGEKHRVAVLGWRHRGQDMRRRCNFRRNRARIVEPDRSVAPVARRADDVPGLTAQPLRQRLRGIAQPEDQQPPHRATSRRNRDRAARRNRPCSSAAAHRHRRFRARLHNLRR